MFDTITPVAVDILDKAIAWVYTFGPVFEPTVCLGMYSIAPCSLRAQVRFKALELSLYTNRLALM